MAWGRALPCPALALIGLQACGGLPGAGPGCRTDRPMHPLPGEIPEASGVVASRTHPGVYWVVNDSGDGLLHAVDVDGTSLDMVRVTGAEHRDWEDLALGPCGETDCLYIGDVGDNDAVRTEGVRVYRVPEPDPASNRPVGAEVFRFRYPGGPRDAEAIFVLPGERLYVVTKGTRHPVALYRYPGALDPDRVKTLVEVRRMSEGPRVLPRQVTGASSTADGHLVALRTYESLGFYRPEGDSLRLLPDGTVNLRTLEEAQGEGVAIAPDGRVVLVGETGPLGRRGSIVALTCRLPR